MEQYNCTNLSVNILSKCALVKTPNWINVEPTISFAFVELPRRFDHVGIVPILCRHDARRELSLLEKPYYLDR